MILEMSEAWLIMVKHDDSGTPVLGKQLLIIFKKKQFS